MNEQRIDSRPDMRELPRRLRLSAREIGVAMALTLAAVLQLAFALTSREIRTAADTQPGGRSALVRSAP